MPRNPAKRRCLARSVDGHPCRRWARRGTDRCSDHDRPFKPRPKQRCTALTRAGTRCRKWALQPPPDPYAPACSFHARPLPGPGDRCRARTIAGRRCRRWGTPASRLAGHPICAAHARGPTPRKPSDKRPCTAHSRAGHPCRAWALPGTDPPRCVAHHTPHFRPPGPADDAAGRVCTATTLSGARCQHWALPHTNPPRCHVHADPGAHGKIRHGYYRRTPFLPPALEAELGDLRRSGETLAAEIVVARLKVAALLAYLAQPGLPAAGRLAAYPLAGRALRTVARLVRTQHALTIAGP